MGRVEGLILLCEARYRLAKIPLLEAVEVQAGFIEQEDRVLVFVCGFGEEHHKKRHEPLEPFGALIQLDLHAQLVFDYDLEVLPVGLDLELARLCTVRVGIPD